MTSLRNSFSTANRVQRRKFLSNIVNKGELIEHGIGFRLKTAKSTSWQMEIARFGKEVSEGGKIPSIFSGDSDLLILLLFHLNFKQSFISSHQSSFALHDIWGKLSQNERNCLIFTYVFSGCDGISTIFGLGKTKISKMISGHLPFSVVDTLRNGSSSKDDIKAAGVEVFKFLLKKGKRQKLSLDELRLQKFKIICGKGKLYPEPGHCTILLGH